MNFIRKFCKTEYAVLIGIVVLAAFLRFYKLETVPSGFYVDEAAIGYNSYSILETGADEYGKFFPPVADHIPVKKKHIAAVGNFNKNCYHKQRDGKY